MLTLTTLLCLLFCQQSKPFEHNAVGWSLDKRSSDLIRQAEVETGALVSAGKFDDLRLALDRIAKQAPQNQDQWVAVVGPVLLNIGSTLVRTTDAPEEINGSSHPAVRSVCAPYVLKILDAKWSTPTFCGLWDIQLSVLFKFHNTETTWDWKSFKGDPKLRKQYVANATHIWLHVVQSCLVLKKEYPEELVRGDPEAMASLPQEYQRSNPVPTGDPKVRKQELEVFERSQRFRAGFALATTTSEYRRRHLLWLRKTLESLYGEDRSKWTEVSEVVNRDVKDPELAKLVIKELTHRKTPDIWP